MSEKRSGITVGQLLIIAVLAVTWGIWTGVPGSKEADNRVNNLQTSQNPATLSESVANKWRDFSFVENIETFNNHDGDVYSKVYVTRGHVTEQTAEELLQAALSVIQFRTFIVVIDDGLSLVAFNWNLPSQSLDQTPVI